LSGVKILIGFYLCYRKLVANSIPLSHTFFRSPLPMSRNLIDEKIFFMLMAIAMLLAVWVLPTWLWQFNLLSKLFS
jgi:hypothetical protein